MSVLKFLSINRIGVILRAYARTAADVPAQVKALVEAYARVCGVVVEGCRVFSRCDILIFSDGRYEGRNDCGLLKSALRQALMPDVETALALEEVVHGDVYCGLLNHGVAKQLSYGCNHSLILSSEASSYLDDETASRLVAAMGRGAKAAGVALGEIRESVLEGRLANSFCLWDNRALITVGGFDLDAQLPADDRLAFRLRGYSSGSGGAASGVTSREICGVEEVIPLARLVEHFGPCIAPVFPASVAASYALPDRSVNPDGRLRQDAKFASKLERQAYLLGKKGFAPSYLLGGVMPAYRTR